MKNYSVVNPSTGKEDWVSRSLAVAVSVYAFIDNKLCILANKRGPGTKEAPMDNVGKWNVVSGYLDYNETIKGCCIREVHEETGVDISGFELHRMDIDDSPRRPGQVVLFRYICGITDKNSNSYLKSPNLKKMLTNKYSEPNEVDEIKWIPLDELYKYDWSSENHKNKIIEYGKYIINYNSVFHTLYRFSDAVFDE